MMQMTIQNYITEDTGARLKFSSPYRKSWLMISVLAMAVAGTFAMFLFLLQQFILPEAGNSLMAIPLPALIIFLPLGVITVLDLLWHLRGLEIVEITASQITIKHQVLGLSVSKTLPAQSIGGVFVSKLKNDWFTYSARGMKFTNFKNGAIAINYGKSLFGSVKTYRFGSILARRDAEQVVRLIHKRFPQYKYRGKKSAG